MLEEEDERRIALFIKQFNESQGSLYKDSLQYHMHRLLEDRVKLIKLEKHLDQMFKAYVNLQSVTKSFITAAATLKTQELQTPINQIKKRYTFIHSTITSLEREQQSTILREAILHCDEAYSAKCEALIRLRKKAKDDLVLMFDHFRLFREAMPPQLSLFIIERIFAHFYLRLVFDAVVLINPHIIKMAFQTLRTRSG